MKLVICSVRDSALNAFGQPFYVVASGAALRSFKDEVNNSDSIMSKHPSDFELYELGVYDDSNASFALHDEPIMIARGKDLVPSAPDLRVA